jgi:hypothetical protein
MLGWKGESLRRKSRDFSPSSEPLRPKVNMHQAMTCPYGEHFTLRCGKKTAHSLAKANANEMNSSIHAIKDATKYPTENIQSRISIHT